jgi:predicted Zn finger-like uncharacterized protein
VSNSLSFKCPHCGTAYRVVPVLGMAATDAEVNCLVCGKPPQSNESILFSNTFSSTRHGSAAYSC